MADFPTQDPYGILGEMKQNGSYVSGGHIVYKANTHGKQYLDKDAHLGQPGVVNRIAELLATGVRKGDIIIAPETRSKVKLVNMVGELTGCDVFPTVKVDDKHTIDSTHIALMGGKNRIVLIDDVFNNGTTYYQIRAFLAAKGLNIDEFLVMVNRNPVLSSTTDIPMTSLATVQMDQWKEDEVPQELKSQPISTKLGNGRNWIPKPGQELAMQFYFERLHKENLGFHLDDNKRVIQMDGDEFFLGDK